MAVGQGWAVMPSAWAVGLSRLMSPRVLTDMSATRMGSTVMGWGWASTAAQEAGGVVGAASGRAYCTVGCRVIVQPSTVSTGSRLMQGAPRAGSW